MSTFSFKMCILVLVLLGLQGVMSRDANFT